MRLRSFQTVSLGLGLVLLFAVSGCLFSPDSDSDPKPQPQPERPFPDSEDQLMANFRQAYSTMDIAWYRDVLHDQYKFMFQQTDIEHLGLPSDHLTREEELLVADNMFQGRGENPIAQITIQVLNPQNAWQDVTDHPDFPNSRRRAYDITMYIERPGATTLKVEGQQEFFVVRHEFVIDGSPREGWQLVGQVDRTIGGI
jgi:hypothetical protein